MSDRLPEIRKLLADGRYSAVAHTHLAWAVEEIERIRCSCGGAHYCEVEVAPLREETKRLHREIQLSDASYDHEIERLREALEFYEGLSVHRHDNVTSIDGGETAQKLHELWDGNVRMLEALEHIAETSPHDLTHIREIARRALEPPK